MTRTYRLQQRALSQEATRLRIVEAAVALHTTVGPARSSVSEIARQAGVERHTFYSHFPDEHTLLAACAELHGEQRPLPDPESWRTVRDRERRLRRGLGELYAFYDRNGDALAPIVRDAAIHGPTQEIFRKTLGKRFSLMRDVLAEPFGARGARRRRLLALLELFLTLDAWRLLARTTRSRAEAVDVAVRALRGVRPGI
jgi:AcrR family transcriptional regulator